MANSVILATTVYGGFYGTVSYCLGLSMHSHFCTVHSRSAQCTGASAQRTAALPQCY